MLLEKLDVPISLINASQYDIEIERLQKKLADAYTEYDWDKYLLQENKISIIKSEISPEALSLVSPSIWTEIYKGAIEDFELAKIFPKLTENTLAAIFNLQPTRRRCISAYSLEWNNGWRVDRLPSQPYVQQKALMVNAEATDYRHSIRQFKELPDALFDEDLYLLITTAADHVRESIPGMQKLHVVVHHTVVYAIPNQLSTNSPEGIHQDGLGFIVSAFVVERKNITGGRSFVYGRDKKTKLLQVELQPGQGIFQPDLGTELWHKVTPIVTLSKSETGYRSTIGIDITIDN